MGKKTKSLKGKASKMEWAKLIPIVISGIALIATVINLCFTYRSNKRQHAQWKLINIGDITCTKINFIRWKVAACDELRKVNWNYSVDAQVLMESGKVTGQCGVIHRLVACDRSGALLNRDSLCFTLSELDEALVREGKDRGETIVKKKHYQLEMEFQNTAVTPMRDVVINVKRKLDDQRPWEMAGKSSPITIPGKDRVYRVFDVYLDLMERFPDRAQISCEVTFTDATGETRRTDLRYYYDQHTSGFAVAR